MSSGIFDCVNHRDEVRSLCFFLLTGSMYDPAVLYSSSHFMICVKKKKKLALGKVVHLILPNIEHIIMFHTCLTFGIVISKVYL